MRAWNVAWAWGFGLGVACSCQSDPSGQTAGGAASGGATASNGQSSGGSKDGGTSYTNNTALLPVPAEPGITKTDKVDLLLVVDNSPKMADKALLFSRAVSEFLRKLIGPPAGSHAPVKDMHIGVITSSLGGHGNPEFCEQGAQNDKAHLIDGTLRPQSGLGSGYNGQGFVKWDARNADDPEKPNPPGTSDVTTLIADVQARVTAAGDGGCEYEATHEAWYRFLVDPAPPAQVVQDQGQSYTVREGIDETLLAQRTAFLRPDSALVIAVVSDENDCSIRDAGYAWVFSADKIYRGTQACATNPNDRCCTYCGYDSAPSGCPDLRSDSGCQAGQDEAKNVRCWDPKRRFGIDFLYPMTRYVAALKDRVSCPQSEAYDGDCLCRHALALGEECDRGKPELNPIYQDLRAAGRPVRDPSLVTLVNIVGVPWQDLATDATVSTAGQLRYEQGAELDWDLFLGDPSTGAAPSDTLMVESTAPRTGPAHPITMIAPAAPEAAAWSNPINGHEWKPVNDEALQYACVFRLEPLLSEPRDCSALGETCECYDASGTLATVTDRKKPVCQGNDGSYGSVQVAAQAYPGLRHMELVRALKGQGLAASICPKLLEGVDPADAAYGYNPAFVSVLERLANVLE